MPLLSDETNGSVLTIESNRCSANPYFHKGTVLELFCKPSSLDFNTCTLRMAVWQKFVQMGLGSCAMQRSSSWIWKASSSLVCCLEKKAWVHFLCLYVFCVFLFIYTYEKTRFFFLKMFENCYYWSFQIHMYNFLKQLCFFFFPIWLFSFIKWWVYERILNENMMKSHMIVKPLNWCCQGLSLRCNSPSVQR